MEGLVHLDFLSPETQADIIRSGLQVDVCYLNWEKYPDRVIEAHFGTEFMPEGVDEHTVVDQFVWTLPIETGTLDKWFKYYQNIERMDRPEVLGIRSMSVGDAFLFRGRPHFCLSPFGWSE